MTDSRMVANQVAGQTMGTKATLRTRLPFILPVVLFLIIAVAFAYGLTRDPRTIPSVLIDKPVPTFALAPVQGRSLGLSSADLKGEVSLVNFFASWCVACLVEHPRPHLVERPAGDGRECVVHPLDRSGPVGDQDWRCLPPHRQTVKGWRRLQAG